MTVITGASGHLGASLIRELLRQGNDIRAVIREDSRSIEGLDVDSLKKAFRGAQTVYHLAAMISISKRCDRYLPEINIKGTANVIEACISCNVSRLMHFSTIHASLDAGHGTLVDETNPLIAKNQGLKYDWSKAEGERLVLKAAAEGLDAVIITPTGIIGPYDFKPSLMGRMLIELYRNKLIALVNGGFNWVDVRDVAIGAVSAEKSGRKGGRYILGGRWATIKELAEILGTVSGRSRSKFAVPMALARIAAPFSSIIAEVRGDNPCLQALHYLP